MTYYISDGKKYYTVPGGLNSNAYESANSACTGQQNINNSQALTTDNGYLLGGMCSNAETSVPVPTNAGFVCDGNQNLWIEPGLNMSGNNWDSSTVQAACGACNSNFNPSEPPYTNIGSCKNPNGYSYTVQSDGNMWYFGLLPVSSGDQNLNPRAACASPFGNPPIPSYATLVGSCAALPSQPQFSYGSSGVGSAAINAEIASAVEPFTLFTEKENMIKPIVIGVIIILILVVLYFLLKSDDKSETNFLFF